MTATADYQHTGGAEERLLTITDGVNTWPSDAELGEVRIGAERSYRVYRRISNTEITLEPDFSFSEDFTGEQVTWERRAYQFSREITKVHYVHNLTLDRILTYMPPGSFQENSYSRVGYGRAETFTWQNHGTRFGAADFVIHPPPISSEIFEVSATVNPLIPKVQLEDGTDAAIAAGSNVMTSATGAFTDKLVGSIVRISSDATSPTYFDGGNWEWQAFVLSVDSATQLTLSENSPAAITGRGYSISSPVDIESSTMLEYVEDEAFHQYTKNHKHESFRVARQTARESLILAIARDNKVSLNSVLWATYNHPHWFLSGGFYTTEAV